MTTNNNLTLPINELENYFKAIQNELQEIKQLALLRTKKVLDMSECSLLTGISESTLYKHVSDKKIPYYKCGKFNYFKKSEVEAWMLQCRVKTNAEIEAEVDSYFQPTERMNKKTKTKCYE
ncbi:MAG: helix-turn-helix domain-containing protein [Bacteroidetes bacterium]|nr:helix-turn-helix domain-containing protein [Bacteroidota bacterium]